MADPFLYLRRVASGYEDLVRSGVRLKNQQASLPGIGPIHSVKIVARIVTPARFADKGHFLSYSDVIRERFFS